MTDFLEIIGLFLGVVSLAVLAYPIVVLQEMLDVVDDICDIDFGGY